MRALAAVVLLLACLGSAHGQKRGVRDEARAHFKRGSAAYAAGDADTAIAEYQAAYRLIQLPDFVFNLAQALRMKGDRAGAVEHYRLYITLDPGGVAVAEAKQRIDEALQSIEKEKKTKEEEEQKKQKQIKEENARAAVAEVKVAPAPEPRPRSGRTLRIAGLTVGAAGLVGLALGGAFVGLASAAHDEYFMPKNGVYSPAAEDRQRTYETLDVAFFAVGGAALAVGATCFFVGLHRDRR